MVKIAFCGKMTSGKTTSANIIKNHLKKNGENVVILSFADRLKELAIELFNMDPNKKDRKLLQNLGQTLREFDKNVWINVVVNKINNLDSDVHILIDDLRMPNEYEVLKQLGFIIVRLEVSKQTQIERLINLYPSNYIDHIEKLSHCTENSLDNYDMDHVIDCNDITMIKNKLKQLIK